MGAEAGEATVGASSLSTAEAHAEATAAGVNMSSNVERVVELMATEEANEAAARQAVVREAEQMAVMAEATAATALEAKFGAQLKETVEWMRQCSKHLHHIEMRTMEGELLGHEVVRQMLQFWTSFIPGPIGDWGWMLRKALDIGVRALRFLVRTYAHTGMAESVQRFVLRASDIVRLYFEESFVRALGSLEGNTEPQKRLRKAALCSCAVTMRNIEARF